MASHNRRYVIAKVDPRFVERLRETALERIRKGLDKKISKETFSVRRFTKAITRYEPLWEILKKAEIRDDN